MSPELVDLIVNLGGTGVLIWVVSQQSKQLADMRKEAREDRKLLWDMLSWLVRRDDSRTDIPILPSQKAKNDETEQTD